MVWEVRCADLSLSPIYPAANGKVRFVELHSVLANVSLADDIASFSLFYCSATRRVASLSASLVSFASATTRVRRTRPTPSR